MVAITFVCTVIFFFLFLSPISASTACQLQMTMISVSLHLNSGIVVRCRDVKYFIAILMYTYTKLIDFA